MILQNVPMAGKQEGGFPPGWRLDILGAITFANSPDGYQAIIDIGHETGETLTIPAVAIDTYAACRKALLKRYAARLVLWEVETCRRASEARDEWLQAVNRAIERGRE